MTQFSGGESAAPGRAWCTRRLRPFSLGSRSIPRTPRALGDFLIVGVHEDAAVRARQVDPVLNAQERALGVMACRHADEVIVGAGGSLGIFPRRSRRGGRGSRIRGRWVVGRSPVAGRVGADGEATEEGDGDDPDAAAKVTGVYAELPPAGPGAGLTTAAIIDRIAANRRAYEARNAKRTPRRRSTMNRSPPGHRTRRGVVSEEVASDASRDP